MGGAHSGDPAGGRVPDAHFERRYRADPDPWRLRDRWYEQRKRALTVAALTRPRYRRAFEPACALGLLTELLAARCDEVVAVDASATAVAATAERLAHLTNVSVAAMSVPDQWPDGSFDLIVLSEVGYYLDATAIAALRDAAVARLTTDGDLIAVHYRPDVPEHRTNGDLVHEVLHASPRLRGVLHHVEDLFRLDVLTRTARPWSAPDAGSRAGRAVS